MRHGIIVPCYNESQRLDSETFVQYAKSNPQNVLCFVNDGSTDDTREALIKIKRLANSSNVYIYNMSKNVGKADAVRQGVMFLYENTDVETIGFLDADLSTTLSEYDILTSEMDNSNGEVQVVFGSRNMGCGKGIERNPIRNFLSKFIKVLIQFITKIRISDTQCGAKVFSRTLVPKVYSKSFFSRWLFDVEIILRLKKRLGKDFFISCFLEKPLNSWIHMEGSKLGFKDSILIPFNLLKIWKEYTLKPSMVDVIMFSRYAINKFLDESITQPARNLKIRATAAFSDRRDF